MNRYLTVILLLLCHCSIALAENALEIIELKSRPADEVIPLIKPFAGPKGVVSGMNNQLIIHTSPERLADIRKILQQIDRPPRRLLIQVHQGQLSDSELDAIRAGASINLGEQGKIKVGEPADKDIHLSARSHRTRDARDITQHVQTIEGQPAFISTGQAIPIRQQSTLIAGGIIQQQQTTEYHDSTTGFYVVPHISGDQVRLLISPHMEHASHDPGSFDIQQAHTTISGKLGQWILVGEVARNTKDSRQGLARHYSTSSREDRQILLLVEEVPQ